MTKFDAMWMALESHQPIADKNGYGEQWKRMCVERTEEAADAASDAASDAARAAAAAVAAVAAVADVADAWAKKAVEHIIKANKEDNT